MTVLFLISVVFCLYTYLFYPLLIWWMSCLRSKPQYTLTEMSEFDWPKVSIVIAAHNEEAAIQGKIENLRSIDYPSTPEIIVVSDGSKDGTNPYLASQHDILFHGYDDARGKPSALNLGIEISSGEIIVFMDARQQVSSNCLKELVKHFMTGDEVGAVSGELIMRDGETGEADNIGLYWRYEKWIRASESRFFSTAGATGALYAIRRCDFHSLTPDTLLDDFEIPINILRKGKRTLFEPMAQAFDNPSSNIDDEFRRKVRTLAGNYQSFVRNPWLFSPFKNPIFIQFLSHKVFRLLVPYAMLAALVSSALTDNPLIKLFFYAQFGFYTVGLAAFMSSRLASLRIVSFIKVFLQMNYAAVYGLYHYLAKRSVVTWKSA